MKRINGLEEARGCIGDRFGRLTITGVEPERRNWQVYVIAKCDCGVDHRAAWYHVKKGKIRSCGCLLKEIRFTHRMTKDPIYKLWLSMKYRCTKPSNPRWKDYGGRGIKICERWMSFENFQADMSPRPSPAHTVDRKNNNGDYEPDNCRWATQHEQSLNKRSLIMATHDGETLPLAEWARRYGLNHHSLYTRVVRDGWSFEEAISRPMLKTRRSFLDRQRSR